MKKKTHIEEGKQTKDGRVQRGEVTRNRVLDAAECCFGAYGYDAVSIRDVAKEAGVSLGVVGFHGGTKEELFLTVIQRRADALNSARLEGLKALQLKNDLTVETLISAYVLPYLEFATNGGLQWKFYAKLVARIGTDDASYDKLRDIFDPVAKLYLTELQAIFPNTTMRSLSAGFTLCVAAMLSLVSSRIRIGGLSGSDITEEPNAFKECLVKFCVGGLKEIGKASVVQKME